MCQLWSLVSDKLSKHQLASKVSCVNFPCPWESHFQAHCGHGSRTLLRKYTPSGQQAWKDLCNYTKYMWSLGTDSQEPVASKQLHSDKFQETWGNCQSSPLGGWKAPTVITAVSCVFIQKHNAVKPRNADTFTEKNSTLIQSTLMQTETTCVIFFWV